MENKTFILKSIWALGFCSFLIVAVYAVGNNVFPGEQKEPSNKYIVGESYDLNGVTCTLAEMEFVRGFSDFLYGNLNFHCKQ